MNNKKYVLIIVVVLMVLVSIGFGIYLKNKNNLPNDIPDDYIAVFNGGLVK